MADFDIAIAGAGIVGISAALWARMRGHKVLLADPNPPGSGASSGNACTLATYACQPLNDPSVIRDLPRLMFDRDSPLAVSYLHALRHPLWMMSFLANCTTRPSRRIAGHLAGLLAHADAGLDPLIAAAGAKDLLVSRGQLSVWSTRDGAKEVDAARDLRRRFGIPCEDLTGEEARSLEPGLAVPVARALFHPAARHIRDPEALVRRMHARFAELGGSTRKARVSAVRADRDGVDVSLGSETVRAGHVVIAAGAFSGRIAGAGTAGLPLGTERGYHLMFEGDGHRLTRPVGWGEGGFYAVPMARGLRLAGTVEIAGLDAPENPGRLAYLARRGAELFGDLPEPDDHWLGFRPTMPDSLPVIGYGATSRRVIHAFGHQHLGLTLGGITGRIVADLVEGRPPGIDLDAFRPDRRYVPF